MDYGWGAQDIAAPKRVALRDVPVEKDLVLEDVQTGFVGAVVRVEKSGGLHVMVLEDRRGKQRTFRLGHGFLVEGEPVKVVAPVVAPARESTRTASGSVRVADARARTARASRIWVEGQHDAELVEKVWGDDLRLEGIVVEPLHGVDDLDGAIRDFAPGPTRRLGILVDHLLPGTKESRIAQQAMTVPGARGHVLIVGHPYVDVWQAVKPGALGLDAWPVVPRGQDWKTGILAGLGWPHRDQAAVAHGWKRILSRVHTYADLEPSLLGRVEEVIDFLTAPV
ncbi:DUF3097 family protein [Arthrobacter agilis]|uniref:DUF3097 family protein n=1 Tax=Arthrobacter agilis TaxID=37921 RepID=UPI000B35B264|nr:DUF3097 family protein [Arthrobacter agilis]OUM45214.1 hypothetical protein B8W74_01250 [Arthrobacter agilis]PPB47523.1 DUF3097 domain-containing protein [Arthrobacter agilis]TPV21701.1 DUF3097 family protein [Arthrobacter agilis]VDR32147.1 Protein of uncharacterised function (DUF3097) [Arthrobacter agilis]